MKPQILAQGAEAKIILSNNLITKDRISKPYRLKALDDKIRKLRTRSEAKLLEKASKVINVPVPEEVRDINKIKMPYIKGDKLSISLDKFPLSKQLSICKQIGKDIAKLHDNSIIHGDLTTSNMILVEDLNKRINKKQGNKVNHQKNSITLTTPRRRNLTESVSEQQQSASDSEPLLGEGVWGDCGRNNPNFKIFFIDFGLGFISHKIEDKAVDLHLLKQALEARHFKNWETLWKEFEKSYSNSSESKKVLERLKAVEKRGRYKEKY